MFEQIFPGVPGVKACSEWLDSHLDGFFWVVAAFTLGLIAQDLYNKKSWIWNNWKAIIRLVDVQALTARYLSESPEPQWITVFISLKTARPIKDGSITMTVYPIHPRMEPFCILHEEGISEPRHSEIKLQVCRLHVQQPQEAARHSYWGEVGGETTLLPGQRPVVGSLNHKVVLEVRSGLRAQKVTFFVDRMDQTRKEKGYVYVRGPDDEEEWRTVNT